MATQRIQNDVQGLVLGLVLQVNQFGPKYRLCVSRGSNCLISQKTFEIVSERETIISARDIIASARKRIVLALEKKLS